LLLPILRVPSSANTSQGLSGPDELPVSRNQSASYSTLIAYLNQVESTCRPVFEEAKSRLPSFLYAGVFGSVSRGSQRLDSDVDILVGYSKNANFFRDFWGIVDLFKQRLPQALGREVDVIPCKWGTYIWKDCSIWGEESWAEDNRKAAECVLREGFTTTMEALQLMRSVQRRLPSSEVCALGLYLSFSVTCCIRQSSCSRRTTNFEYLLLPRPFALSRFPIIHFIGC